MEKAISAFNDFVRMIHFLIGRFDKKHVIKIGLPLLPSTGDLVYINTQSIAILEENGSEQGASIDNKYSEKIPLDDKFFQEPLDFKNIWQIQKKVLLNEKNNSVTKLEKRLLNCALALGESALSEDVRNSIIYSCVALETLFSFDEGSLFKPGIGEQIAEALTFVVALPESRLDTFKKVKKIYSLRSALVHGAEGDLNNDYIWLNILIRTAIKKFLTDKKYATFKSIDDFYLLIRKVKFGVETLSEL
jgi:hypothetical protein